MRIEGYRFGRIRVDGVEYCKDLFIAAGVVRSPWWRAAGGHLFAPEDLGEVLAARPSVVVLGTGYFGMVRVADETLESFAAAGVQVISGRTGRMVEELNRLMDKGVDVAAALHLTC